MKIKYKIIILIVVPFMFLMAANGYLLSKTTSGIYRDEIKNHLSSIASLKEITLDQFISSAEDQVKEQQNGLGYKYRIKTINQTKTNTSSTEYQEAYQFLKDRFDQYSTTYPQFTNILLVDKDGEIIYSGNTDESENVGKQVDQVFSFDFLCFFPSLIITK